MGNEGERIVGSRGSLPEDGDGRSSPPGVPDLAAGDPGPAPVARSTYSGIIRLREGAVYLVSGGIEVRVEPASLEQYRHLSGRTVTVTGQQRGAAIVNAELASQALSAGAPASGSDGLPRASTVEVTVPVRITLTIGTAAATTPRPVRERL